jgi:pimeloyl-ACP methyl ester carboxylesterase
MMRGERQAVFPMDMIGQGHETTVDGTSIAWGEMGSGAPLVLVHGIRDSHRCWRRLAPLLSERFRVLMPDLPGHGLSARPDAPYTLTWYAEILSAWMDAIGVPRAHVCGHSLGGGIAQWMLLDYRQRVDRLGLVSPGGLGREVGMGLKFATVPLLGARLAPLVVRYGFHAYHWLRPATFGNMEPDEVARFLKINQIPGSERAFLRSVESVINLSGQYVQTVDRAHEVEDLPPIALFWGEQDPILPVQHGRTALARSVGISLTTYPRCGHFPQLQVPALLARDLAEFLSDPDRPCARMFPARRGKASSGDGAIEGRSTAPARSVARTER